MILILLALKSAKLAQYKTKPCVGALKRKTIQICGIKCGSAKNITEGHLLINLSYK